MSGYTKPLPRITAQSRPFWEAAHRHQLQLPSCDACGAPRAYFESWCNQCGHDGFHWVTLSGRGRIWANCRMHKAYFEGFAPDLPYNVAIVELDEGPRLVTNIVGLPTGALSEMPIGMPVHARFDDVTADVTLIRFEPDTKDEPHA